MVELIDIIPESFYFEIENIVNASEGKFPSKELSEYFKSNNLKSNEVIYNFAKYLVYKGIEISLTDEFFDLFEGTNTNPGLIFWASYDALIRSKITIFKELWGTYESIELKNFTDNQFLKEAIVIPEDPVFINVSNVVHPQQKRLISNFLLSDQDSVKISDEVYDAILDSFLENFSPLLAFFRIQHLQFERNITIDDLKLLDELLDEKILRNLGKYWEIRILSLLSAWRVDLGLIYESTQSLNDLKILNGEALSYYIECLIFHMEAITAVKNNNRNDFFELLQSAEYLAKEFNYGFLLSEVLISKAKFDINNLPEIISEIEKITTEDDHKLIRAKIYSLSSSYYISKKDWKRAESELLKASKFLHDKFDLKSYYQVISDFSYVLIVSNQIRESLESSQVLLEDEVPVLFKLRGYYLYSLGKFILGNHDDAIIFIEEGIRIALNFKEDLSVPWFYELLSLIYLSLNDWNMSLKYSGLTYKGYFDINKSEEGYNSRLITAYLLALDGQYGQAFTQIKNLLTVELDIKLLTEVLWALQGIVLLSTEKIDLTNYDTMWMEKIAPDTENQSILDLYDYKRIFSEVPNSLEKKFHLNILLNHILELSGLLKIDLLIWILIIQKSNLKLEINAKNVFGEIAIQISNIKIAFESIRSFKLLLLEESINLNNLENENLIKLSFLISILRIIRPNLPFPDLL